METQKSQEETHRKTQKRLFLAVGSKVNLKLEELRRKQKYQASIKGVPINLRIAEMKNSQVNWKIRMEETDTVKKKKVNKKPIS